MNLIVAFNENYVIGTNNTIPWYIPEDLKKFKQLTNNEIVVMGRKTFESLPNGPLKNRIHVVITNQTKYYQLNDKNIYYCNFENSLTLLENLKKQMNKHIFIIGGSQIYKTYFPYCLKFYITVVNNNTNGDVYFPFELSIFDQSTFVKKKDEIITSVKNISYRYLEFER